MMSGKNRFVVQGCSELPGFEGYEKVPADEPSDHLVSYEADDTEILADQVSRRHSCIRAANGLCSIYCFVLCIVSFMLVSRSLYF